MTYFHIHYGKSDPDQEYNGENMATSHRIASESGYYHIMARGNNRTKIFGCHADCRQMLRLMKRLSDQQEIRIYAYCVMPNHYHILLRASGEELSGGNGRHDLQILAHAMHRINTAYAHYYKNKYEYVGHVFQGRYLSRAIDSHQYLSRVIRYIHDNPVKASLTKLPEEYSFSSYRSYFFKPGTGHIYGRGIIAKDSKKLLRLMGFSNLSGFEIYHKAPLELDEWSKALFLEEEEAQIKERKMGELKEAKAHLRTNFEQRSNPQQKSDPQLNSERIAYAVRLREETCLSLRTISKITGVSKIQSNYAFDPDRL